MFTIEEVESVYYVSEEGCVENRKNGYELKPYVTHKGYLTVHLSIKGKRSNEKLHRLVGMKFIPNPDNLPQINHKDGVKKNCHKDNLEWCTNESNHKHAVENGLYPRGEKRCNAKFKNKEILEIRSRILRGDKYKDLWKEYGRVSWWAFRDICRGDSYKDIK